MSYRHIKFPETGQKVTISRDRLVVPENPILALSKATRGRRMGSDEAASMTTMLGRPSGVPLESCLKAAGSSKELIQVPWL